MASRFATPLDPINVVQQVGDTYDYDSFTVADGSTNTDIASTRTNMFKNVHRAWGCIIWSDQDITVRFNATGNPGITHEAVYSPHEWFDKLEITNIYITNSSGSTANIKIFLV